MTPLGRRCLEYLATVDEATPWELGCYLHTGEARSTVSFSWSGTSTARHLVTEGLAARRFDAGLGLHLYRICDAGRVELAKEIGHD